MSLLPMLFPFLLSSGEPEPISYDEIRICGELKVDEVEFFFGEIEDSYLFDRGKLAQESWTEQTILLMPFENTLDAGNFPTLGNPVLYWRIYRRISGETEFTFLEEIPNISINSYFDVRSASGVDYEYGIQSVAEDGTRGGILVSEVVEMEFWGWKLASTDYNEDAGTGTIYTFDTELNSGAINKGSDRTVYETYALRPKVVRGKRLYNSGSLSFIPTTCNGETLDVSSNALVSQLESFLTNGEKKVLKNGSGKVFTVDIDESSVSLQYRDLLTNPNKYEQPLVVSFSWIEIDDPLFII